MTKVYRVAIVGAGIGEQHAVAFIGLPDQFMVTYICDQNRERAEKLADRIVAAGRPRPEIAADFDAALLAQTDIDIIDICAPPFLHRTMAMAALEAGKHVICEKPLVGSLAEVDELAVAAAASGKTLMPVFQYRFGRGLDKARHLMRSGAAGKVYLATVETHWTRGADYYAIAWRGKKATELGGGFLGHTIHAHDMLTHLVGPVRSVAASVAVRVNPIETEDCGGAIFDMADGSIAVSSLTLGSADEISRLRICCENVTMMSNLSAYAPDRDPWTFLPKAPKDEAFIAAALADVVPQPEGYLAQMKLYHAALETGGALPVTLDDARHSIELVTAIYHSAASGRRITLPIASTDPWCSGWP